MAGIIQRAVEVDIPAFKYFDATLDATGEESPFGFINTLEQDRNYIYIPSDEDAAAFFKVPAAELEAATWAQMVDPESVDELNPSAPRSLGATGMEQGMPSPANNDQPRTASPFAVPEQVEFTPASRNDSHGVLDNGLVARRGVTSSEASLVLGGPPKKKRRMFGRD